MKLTGSPLKTEFLRKKLKLVRDTMEAQGVDMWITFTREGNEDPLVQDLRFSDLTWRSAAIIERTGTKTAIVGSLEEETVRQQKFYDEIIGYGSEGAAPKLNEFVRKRKPKKIAVNTSYDEGAADGLTSGMERYLKTALKDYSKRLVSGEDLVIALRARLIPAEIELVKKSIAECEKIYDSIEAAIKPGKKDKDVHEFAHKLLTERKLDSAWAYDRCPSVVVGNAPMAHGDTTALESRTGTLSSSTLASNTMDTVATSRETTSSDLDECQREWSRCSRLLAMRMMLLSAR